MSVEIARTAGFCRGVARAVRICEEAVAEGKRAVTLGPVIHNRDEVMRLERLGVRVGMLEDLQDGETAIICSHGATADAISELRRRGIDYIDATCPDVARIHAIVSAEPRVIVFGDREHTEVRGITSRCKEVEVFATVAEFMAWLTENGDSEPLCIVAQTTFLTDEWEKFTKQVCTNAKIFDTICRATSVRQREATEMAARLPSIVVVGSRSSANTRRLFELCLDLCGDTIWVENASQLPVDKLYQDVGIIAGASTPRWIIEEVASMFEDKIIGGEPEVEAVPEVPETPETNEAAEAPEAVEAIVTDEAPVADAVAEAPEVMETVEVAEPVAPVSAVAGEMPDAQAPASSGGEDSFEALLEQSLRTLTSGDKVKGVVTGIGNTEIQIDLGAKHAGFLAIEELSDDPSKPIDELIKIGDEIEIFVVRVNDADGIATLSRRRLDAIKGWEDVQAACDAGTTVEGFVTEENKGGIVVSVKGVRVFVPASQTGIPRDGDMSSLIKTKVQLKIREVNQARKRVVGSIRAVGADRRREAQTHIWDDIQIGAKFEGTVRSMLTYGAFIDIGGVDGMVHVSEMSWKRVHQPSDLLSVGDKVEVTVIAFDKDKRKISLSMRDPAGNPWTQFVSKFNVGDIIDVKVVKLMAFGAFAEIVPGVDGLIHISQIADRRIAKPGDVLSEGQAVTVKITNIDFEKQKVWLSIRALIEPEEVDEADESGEVEYVTDTVVASSEEGKLEISEGVIIDDEPMVVAAVVEDVVDEEAVAEEAVAEEAAVEEAVAEETEEA